MYLRKTLSKKLFQLVSCPPPLLSRSLYICFSSYRQWTNFRTYDGVNFRFSIHFLSLCHSKIGKPQFCNRSFTEVFSPLLSLFILKMTRNFYLFILCPVDSIKTLNFWNGSFNLPACLINFHTFFNIIFLMD